MNYDDVRFIMDSCGGGKKMDGCGKKMDTCKGKSCDACNQKDSCKTKDECGGKGDGKGNCGGKGKMTLDAMDAMDRYNSQDMAMTVASAVHEWVETDDLEDGETLAERLQGLIVESVIPNDSGEDMTREEMAVADEALNAAYNYLVSRGISPEDAENLLGNLDEPTASRVRDYLAETLPDGEEADDDLNTFAFSEYDQEPLMDSVKVRKRGIQVVRHADGSKSIVRHTGKRMVQSAAFKAHLRKLHMKKVSAKTRAKLRKVARMR